MESATVTLGGEDVTFYPQKVGYLMRCFGLLRATTPEDPDRAELAILIPKAAEHVHRATAYEVAVAVTTARRLNYLDRIRI